MLYKAYKVFKNYNGLSIKQALYSLSDVPQPKLYCFEQVMLTC